MAGICRLCASLRKMDALTPLTDCSHEVCRKLRECFKVEIHMEDSMPKNVCSDCVQALNTTFAFYSKVQEAQELLATLFPAEKRPTPLPTPPPTLAESITQAVKSSALLSTEWKRNADVLEDGEDAALLEQPKKYRKRFPATSRSGCTASNVLKSENNELREVYELEAPEYVEEEHVVMLAAGKVVNDGNVQQKKCINKKENPKETLIAKEFKAAAQLVKVETEEEEEDIDGVEIESLDGQQEDEQYEISAEYRGEFQRELQEELQDELQGEFMEELQELQKELQVELQEELSEELQKDALRNVDQAAREERNASENEEQEKDAPVEEEHLEEEHIHNGKKNLVYAEVQHEIWSAYSWRCFLCAHVANSFTELFAHAQQEHAIRSFDDLQFTCSDCQRSCSRYYQFLNHVRTHHHPVLALCCDRCDEHFDDYAELDRHRREHRDSSSSCSDAGVNAHPEVELCVDCGRSFATQIAVRLHVRSLHTEAPKSHECDTCGMCFRRLSNLRAHQRVHSDDKAFVCELCGREFKHKINLDVHFFTHISEKQFQCPICNKKFKTSINLEKHAIVHTDVKDWNCTFCGKEFRTKDAKNSHERTHTGEMPYGCKYCERRFRFRSTLTSHTNTHESVKPYSCCECDHHFNNWSNYNKHMKRRHGAEAVAKAKLTNKKSKTKRVDKLEERSVDNPDESSSAIDDAIDVYEIIEMPMEEETTGVEVFEEVTE